MVDTTSIIYNYYIDSSSLDSINQKLSELQLSTSNFESSDSINILVPLLSSLLGGLLVIIGQWIERKRHQNIDRNKNLLEIYSNCKKLEFLMKNNYRELAMVKSHVEYWWYCYKSANSKSSDIPRYYEEHLRSQASAREIERRIGDTKAEFIGYVKKFQAIRQIGDVEEKLEKISDLTNAKAKSYDLALPYEEVRNNLYEKDEQTLKEVYYQNLLPFKEVNQILEKKISI